MTAELDHTVGSVCLIQRALGSIHSAEMGPMPPQLTANAGSLNPSSSICADCLALRTSIHSKHLRRGLTMITMMSGVRLQQVQSSIFLLVFVVQCDHSASCCVDAQSSDTLIHTSGSVRHRILHSLAQASPPIKRVLLSMAKTREVRLVLVSTRRQ